MAVSNRSFSFTAVLRYESRTCGGQFCQSCPICLARSEKDKLRSWYCLRMSVKEKSARCYWHRCFVIHTIRKSGICCQWLRGSVRIWLGQCQHSRDFASFLSHLHEAFGYIYVASMTILWRARVSPHRPVGTRSCTGFHSLREGHSS